MKCQECVDEGVSSKVHPGGSYTTLMCIDSYYDEDGEYHYHDPNTHTTSYLCSKGHEWSRSWKGTCPHKDCAET